MKVLVVEDDPMVSQSLQYLLASYHYAVDIAVDGEAGLQMAEAFGYDLIVLDLILPRLDGLGLCQQLRAKGCQIPILLLTGQDGVHQKAISLNAGADDYVVKPFDTEELMARVQALLRRGDLTTQPILSWGHLRVDPIAHRVTYGTDTLAMTPKEFAILELFLRNAQTVFSPQMILDQVWESAESPGEEAVRVHIKELRKKLGRVGAPKDFIQTVYRTGYQLNLAYSSALVEIPDEQLSAPQIAELKAAKEKLEQLQVTQAELNQKNDALERAHQTFAQERQQLERVQAHLEDRVAARTRELAQANHQCQLREFQWQALFGQALDAMVIADDDGCCVETNPAACDLFGATSAQLRPRRLGDFVGSGQDFSQVWQQFLQQGRLSTEGRIVRADNTIRHTEFKAIANVVPGRHLLIFRDISERAWLEAERKRLETERQETEVIRQAVDQALQNSEDRLHLALDLTGIGSWDWQMDTGVVTWNANHYHLYGYEPGEVEPSYPLCHDPVHPEDVTHVEQRLTAALETQTDYEAEYRVLWADGSVHWMVGKGRAIYDDEGQPIRMVGVILDVTDRKQLEVDLRQREARQRALIEAIPDLIERINREGIYLEFIAHPDFPVLGNDAAIVGSHVSTQLPTAVAQQRMDYIQQALQTQSIQIYEQDLSRAGKTQIEEVRVVPYNEDEVLLLIRDITDRKQADVQLQGTAQRLALATRAAKIGIWEHELGTDRLIWDRYICELYGFDPEAFDGRYDTWRQRMHPEDLAMAEALVQKTLDGEQDGFQCEIRAVLPNGQIRFIEAHAIVVRDAENVPRRIIGANRDISDRKQAEVQLQQITQRLALATHSAQIGVWELDFVENRFVCDERMHEIYGLPPGELNGNYETWRCRVHPDDLSATEIEVQAAIAGDRDYHAEFRIVQPNGQIRHVEAHGIVLRDPGGLALSSTGVNWDITDRKQAEQKIQEQAALLDIASDAIIVRDLDQQILYWNKGAERLYGWLAAEVIGQPADRLLRPDTGQTATIMAQLLDQGEWQGEMRKVTKTGEEVIVAGRWTLAQHGADQPKFILSVATDITDQKRLEAQFHQSQRLDSLGRLASGIAHDLNNVFTPILTMAQLLSLIQPDLKTNAAQEQLRLIEESAKQGANMVQQILTFARGSSEARTVVDLAALLQDVATLIRQSFPKSIDIRQDSPEPGQSLRAVLANPTQLHQVLMNLCINARDAMAGGGVLTLTAKNIAVDAALARKHLGAQVGDYVVITVGDTGTGMTPEV